jgi:hypothetical protein
MTVSLAAKESLLVEKDDALEVIRSMKKKQRGEIERGEGRARARREGGTSTNALDDRF